MAAFETLYRRHKDPLWRYLLRGAGDREVVAEMFQEVWSGVVRSRGSYETRARFTTWLYTLAHNRLVDYYRLRKLATAPLEDAEDVAAPEQDTPDALARGGQLRQRLLTVLAQLPQEQREAFLLKEEGGLSLEEIGQATGVGRETVKSRLRYALVKLRQELSDDWP
ncbi:MAG TPA: sigma-70 family RNA polymerase sigma factor [Solimonas sp.]|nr:sigma-70 family RNA polymerase sigma factor [Solimonas sp.]